MVKPLKFKRDIRYVCYKKRNEMKLKSNDIFSSIVYKITIAFHGFKNCSYIYLIL